MTTKHMIGDLSTNEKLDRSNYDIWHRKIRYLLNEREVLETLSSVVLLMSGIKRILQYTKHDLRRIVPNSTPHCTACVTISLENLRLVLQLRKCGTRLGSCLVRLLLQGFVA